MPPAPGGRIEGGRRLRGILKSSEPGRPLITVITVVFNRVRHLQRAIESVLSQSYENIEYIIIDGGSTDGTLDVIRKFDDSIDYWLSEADAGIYNAMNKGIRLCSGEIIGLLNADDFYFPSSGEEVVSSYNYSGSGIYYGKQMNFIEYEDFCYFAVARPDLSRMFEKPSIFHPACFVHNEVYKRVGLFDEGYKVIADYDFLLRCLESEVPFFLIDKTLTGFRSGGASGSVKIWLESYRLLREHPKHLCPRRRVTLMIIIGLLKRWSAKIINYERRLYLKRKEVSY